VDECKYFSGQARNRQSHTCNGVEVYLISSEIKIGKKREEQNNKRDSFSGIINGSTSSLDFARDDPEGVKRVEG